MRVNSKSRVLCGDGLSQLPPAIPRRHSDHHHHAVPPTQPQSPRRHCWAQAMGREARAGSWDAEIRTPRCAVSARMGSHSSVARCARPLPSQCGACPGQSCAARALQRHLLRGTPEYGLPWQTHPQSARTPARGLAKTSCAMPRKKEGAIYISMLSELTAMHRKSRRQQQAPV